MRILVVEAEPTCRSQLASWLTLEFDVVTCPGPQTPGYTCPGGRGEVCNLAESADLVVLDLWVEGDTFLSGTAGWELLFYYRSLGKPVVVLTDPHDPIRPLQEEGVAVLRRPADRPSLLRAVRGLLAGAEWTPRGPGEETVPDAIVAGGRPGSWEGRALSRSRSEDP